jgi:hypothetical protein
MSDNLGLQIRVDPQGIAKVEYSALAELLSYGNGTLEIPYADLAAFLRALGGHEGKQRLAEYG